MNAPLTKQNLDPQKLPRHIAIIMDGNGRWAKQRGNLRIFGHRNAVRAVRDTTEGAAEVGIPYLTLFAFSTENWARPQTEVNALMELLVSTIRSEIKTLQSNNIRLHAIGDLAGLPDTTRGQLLKAIDDTARNDHMTLTLALNYGSRKDVIQATRKIAEQLLEGKITLEDITPEFFATQLSTTGLPDPELLIRTSGEMRISNFLLWEIAYAELYITPKLWPDFRREDLFEAIADFQKRERRFGKTGEQIKQLTK